MTASPPTDEERMVVAAAAELGDGEVVFVGIGVPSLAAVLAKRTHAPGLTLIYESGVVDALPPYPPMSTGSPSVLEGAALAGECLAVFGALQAGRMDVGLLSAAQMDRRGNLNSTVIGDYAAPKVRMVGSGGAHDIATLVARTIIVMPHDPRRFVTAVDFVTSPGHPPFGTRSRGGPAAVVTPRGRFVFVAGDMHLAAVQAGFTPQQATEGFGWEPALLAEIGELPPPDPAVLDVLRHEVDPPRHP
jgi:glutaconate CoA-transferase subunit B